ncbi:ThuA domain-containing protein [Flagellimonas lutaonensis]|uniref:PKD domain containing protein n=1 Tax=Flagellimonas lutaonensis TaxID=516051 RepID=A0A0D5YT87_9FLAO|nr:ThuA domain-containing protein [Allomuricauda lutaonensis]AKA35109.1 PKD domain containing protein [Allomuricauda lutaonensis]
MDTVKMLLAILLCWPIVSCGQEEPTEAPKKPDLVLVFTKTAGYRHQSIEKGVKTLRELGRNNNFIALQTESGDDFNADNLKNYQLVVFLNTTMDVLDDDQQRAFENYIKSGGSFLGIHAAADTEYEWPWYGKLVGGYFNGHPNNPNVRKATIEVLDKSHPSTAHLPDQWVRSDEWYNYKDLNPNMNVLMNLDEDSYEGGTNGDNHPIAWYHEFEGGRAYYTGGGHTDESFDEPEFRKHLLGAIEWCLGR